MITRIMVNVKTAVTIGGSDPSGAGGIQGDLKVFGAYRVYGMSVMTAVTSQNTQGIKEIMTAEGINVTIAH